MTRGFVFIVLLIQGTYCVASDEYVRIANILESQELSRQHQIQEIYSDSVVRTLSGIWDLDTDTQLAIGLDGSAAGTFLDFDLATGNALYRLEFYNPSTRKSSFTLEVRNQNGEILFSKTDIVSYKPEAYFTSEGSMILSRTNNPNTLELELELHSIESGELVWRRTTTGSPRWRLSADSQTFVELLSEKSDNYFHTAVLFDTLTQRELSRCDLRSFKIKRGTDYLISFVQSVGVLSGQSGTLIANGPNKTLAPIADFSGGFLSSSPDPKIDSHSHYIILHASYSSFDTPSWIVFDSRNGDRIADNLELRSTSPGFGFSQIPAISASGELIYQAIGDGKFEVWNPHTKTLVRELSYTNIPFNHIVPSSDDRYLFACALDAASDDFIVLIDTETNLPVYSKIIDDPDIFSPPSGNGYVIGYNRTLFLSTSRDRYFFQTVDGFEAFDLRTGTPVNDGSAFKGKAITSTYIAAEQSWITVYQTGHVKIESIDPNVSIRWIHLPNITGIKYASIDSQSGSIAFQRDTAFFITHPFDNREDQWVTDLSFGIYPISLHGRGKWLAAYYRGIYDLEAEEWLPLDSTFYSLYAIDNALERWARYDWELDAAIVYDIEAQTRLEIPFSGSITQIRDMKFSADEKQLYFLAQTPNGGHYNQSLFVVDIANREIVQRLDIKEHEDYYIFTQMQVYPSSRKVIFARRSGKIQTLDLDSNQESLPTFIEPIFSADKSSDAFFLSQPTIDGTFRFLDEFGHLYQMKETTARLIPSIIHPSSQSDSQLSFEKRNEREYWIQTSENLNKWSTHPDTQSIAPWFNSKVHGFFRVFESEKEYVEN